ncbi:MAG: sigma-70 family RNA polymerase sigma factor [Crocinitomicaceae bacterium]|nr:sigma-70 family RNA polymerase sigma factor [Crocinitomicaceae bacterium]
MLFGLFSRRHIGKFDDAELIQLIQENNRQALGEIFQRYSPLVMGLCLKYMKDVQAAEDVMMDLFEKLPDKIAKSDISNFKNWLYSVSRNECLMVLRKKNLETGDLETASLFSSNQDEQQLYDVLQKEEKISALEEAIQLLKEEQKKCIELFFLKKKSYEEITSATGYEIKKVKSYIQNGKRNLKLIMENNSESK